MTVVEQDRVAALSPSSSWLAISSTNVAAAVPPMMAPTLGSPVDVQPASNRAAMATAVRMVLFPYCEGLRMLATFLAAVAVWFGVHTLYVVAMSAKAAYEAGRLTTYWIVVLAPALVLGLVLDFVFQFTFGWVLFVETPFRGGALFSGRVKHHFRYGSGWRLRLARFFARNLNVFDPFHITPPKG